MKPAALPPAPSPRRVFSPGVPREIQVSKRQSTAAAAPKKRKSGVDPIWSRTTARNERNKLMHIDKEDMNREQKKQRKAAKNTSKSLLKNEGNKQMIVQGILATDGVGLSQATEYVEGATINGSNFCSQKAVKFYRYGYESDSDSE